MIGLEDRQALARNIEVAHQTGARLRLACDTAGIDLRTLQRWQAGSDAKPDASPDGSGKAGSADDAGSADGAGAADGVILICIRK